MSNVLTCPNPKFSKIQSCSKYKVIQSLKLSKAESFQNFGCCQKSKVSPNSKMPKAQCCPALKVVQSPKLTKVESCPKFKVVKKSSNLSKLQNCPALRYFFGQLFNSPSAVLIIIVSALICKNFDGTVPTPKTNLRICFLYNQIAQHLEMLPLEFASSMMRKI